MTISLPKRLLTVATTALAALGLSAAGGWAAQQPQLIKYTTGMKLSSLSQHHDSDLVQLKSGKKITVGTLRLLDREAVKVRAAVPDSKRSPLLKFKPQANNIKGKISNISDYNAALKNADHETWKLPSGRLVTTGQLKFIQPHADKLLNAGPLKQQPRPNLTGPAINITPKTDWKAVAKMPDSTVLEMQVSKKRVTVGELKQELAKMKQSGHLPPLRILPEAGAIKGGVK